MQNPCSDQHGIIQLFQFFVLYSRAMHRNHRGATVYPFQFFVLYSPLQVSRRIFFHCIDFQFFVLYSLCQLGCILACAVFTFNSLYCIPSQLVRAVNPNPRARLSILCIVFTILYYYNLQQFANIGLSILCIVFHAPDDVPSP